MWGMVVVLVTASLRKARFSMMAPLRKPVSLRMMVWRSPSNAEVVGSKISSVRYPLTWLSFQADQSLNTRLYPPPPPGP